MLVMTSIDLSLWSECLFILQSVGLLPRLQIRFVYIAICWFTSKAPDKVCFAICLFTSKAPDKVCFAICWFSSKAPDNVCFAICWFSSKAPDKVCFAICWFTSKAPDKVCFNDINKLSYHVRDIKVMSLSDNFVRYTLQV